MGRNLSSTYIDGPKRELSVFFSCVLGGKIEAGGKRTKRS